MNDLIVFVHVPKTAGSTLNRILADWGEGHAHCEGLVGDVARFTKVANESDWVSSHLPLPQFVAELRAVTARHFRIVTMVRDPLAQVASHYNWLIEIFHRGQKFYEGHPEAIKKISSDVRAADNADSAAVVSELIKARGLFMNLQSRIALGADVSDWTPDRVRGALGQYDLLATDDRVHELAEQLTGVQLSFEIKENTSRYHFDKKVFQSPEVQELLLGHNRGDISLYREVRALIAD